MATTPEGKVKNEIKKILKGYGDKVYWFMPAMGSFGKSGVPDFIICAGGFFLGVETKYDRVKNPPTELQVNNLQGIVGAGGVSMVVDKDNLDEFRECLEELLREE